MFEANQIALPRQEQRCCQRRISGDYFKHGVGISVAQQAIPVTADIVVPETGLSPVGEVARRATAVPSLPREWGGRTIGFLDNTKSNFDRLSTGIGELLRERYGVATVVHRRKAHASTPAAPELIKTCDVVFAGSAD